MQAYNIFSVANGNASEGAEIRTFKLGNGGEILAILIGEEGRGRALGVLPVDGVTPPEEIVISGLSGERRVRPPLPRLRYASRGVTRSGRPKLFAAEAANTDEAVIVVFNGDMGFRGTYSVSGDDTGEYLCGADGSRVSIKKPMNNVETLVEGRIAQGAAGYAGSGTQRIVLLPRGVVLAERRTGRLYGAPGTHYVLWDGTYLHVRTRQERELADDEIFPPYDAQGAR